MTAAAAFAARGMVTMLGLTSTRGIHLAAWGVALLLLAAPIDDLWHRLFGLDVTLWSPPHLLGLLGSAVNTIGTLLIAIEAYAPASRARLAALVLGGGLLYGGVRVVLEPAWLTAYTHGGVAFHAFAMLAPLLLPLALIPGTRLLDRRWAPLALVVVSLAASLIGEQIARVGFAIMQPEPVITEEIKKDPTSPIALAAEIREKNRGSGPPWVVRLMLPVLAAAVLVAVGPAPAPRRRLHRLRRRDARAVRLVDRPDAGVPSAWRRQLAETALALMITVVAALIGSGGGRWVAQTSCNRWQAPSSRSAEPPLAREGRVSPRV